LTSIAHLQPPRPACTAPVGVIYLLHFERPYRHARHYSGWTADLIDRLWQHAQGHGARLMTVISEAGIGFTLVRVREGTRSTERSIKNAGGAVRYCPVCTARPRNGRWGELPADLVPRYYPCRPPGGPQWVPAPSAAADLADVPVVVGCTA
jgi:predicted GIY-YIG superfamily endonuclease